MDVEPPNTKDVRGLARIGRKGRNPSERHGLRLSPGQSWSAAILNPSPNSDTGPPEPSWPQELKPPAYKIGVLKKCSEFHFMFKSNKAIAELAEQF